MTKKTLNLAYMDIVNILKDEYPNIKSKAKLHRYAKEIQESIDWNNDALMHKGLRWITTEYMRKRGFCNAV